MILKVVLRTGLLALLAAVVSAPAQAQDINTLKSGVVRIENSDGDGTGIIIRIPSDGSQAYIITCAHVVAKTQHPRIYLFNHQEDALEGDVLHKDSDKTDDTEGLALLRVKLPAALVSGITALNLSNTSQLVGGEDVKIIGFPGTAFWTVTSGNIARIEGSSLVFSGSIVNGNSGGPVILKGTVIGMVTFVGQPFARALRGEIIEPWVNGVRSNLISLTKPATVSEAPFVPKVLPPSDSKVTSNVSTSASTVELIPFQDTSGKYGFKDKATGDVLIAAKYDLAYGFYNGLANVYLNKKQGFIDKDGKVVIPLIYDSAPFLFFADPAGVCINSKCGFIDRTGNTVIPFRFTGVGQFSEGLAPAADGKWGVIDLKGNPVIPFQYDMVGGFSDGLAYVKLNNKYGFIDKNNKLVLELQYDDAWPFFLGKARVKLNNRTFYIDTKGNEVSPN